VNTQISPAPVRKSIHVDALPERAFEVFTTGIGRWWPKTHKIGPADLDRPVIEPREGGRWFELHVDGSECEIGKVGVWEPPSRLVLIWQLTPEFQYDPDLITEVEVRFTPDGSPPMEKAPAWIWNTAIWSEWVRRPMRCARPSAARADGLAFWRSSPKKQPSDAKETKHERNHRLWNSRKSIPPDRRGRA
jgi:hypothetical protein